MVTRPFRVELLATGQDRTLFTSGSEPLDRYFRQQVSQDVRRRVTSCFVALDQTDRVAGFYTLASSSVVLSDLPPVAVKKLPRYPSVPVVRMGRLAIDQGFQGKGLGGALMADALDRSRKAEIAAYALVVDAKDKAAVHFYQHHGFIALASLPMTLFLPLATTASLSA